ELGYDLNAVSDNRVFTMGRTPNSPFIMSSVSREIVRNLLTDLRYGDDAKARQKKNEAVSDQTAMDAFASMKGFLPARNDNIVETMIKSLAETPAKVYMPTSLKAAVDLEMDVVIENGAYLQKCELCKDYFMRSEDYDYEYCDKLSKSGRSCLDIMSKKGAVKEKKKIESIDAALLNERCDRLYKEMSARINVEFTQRDFSDWCRYMNTMRDNILSGDASLRDFENFAEYSRSMSFLPGSKKITSGNTALANNRPEKPAESKDSRGRTVKPFVFERVDRREMERAENMLEHYAPDDEEELPVTPTVTHKTPTPAPAPARARTRIIRGRGPGSYSTSGDVTIPYESENLYPPQPPRREEVSAKKEEDVKIYSVKSKEPEKPQEYVKLFSPKTKKPPPPAPSVINIASPPPAEIPSPISRPPRERAEIPAAPAISLAVPKPKEAKVYASQKFEETQEIGFEQLLKGLERRDGFDNDNIPTDSDGMPVSHKTKRVMDAIFKQSKPSLFINVNKGEE
ncbi:MAG: DUF6076 domain-containing protein, partial [Oscillospiraceae bacterium]|nr:DUF6076 domain-containing protein [Oscillospiraceae bacterium]